MANVRYNPASWTEDRLWDAFDVTTPAQIARLGLIRDHIATGLSIEPEDLTRRFGRGFGQRNVEGMRQFFLVFPTTLVQERLISSGIPQTVSADLPAAARPKP